MIREYTSAFVESILQLNGPNIYHCIGFNTIISDPVIVRTEVGCDARPPRQSEYFSHTDMMNQTSNVCRPLSTCFLDNNPITKAKPLLPSPPAVMARRREGEQVMRG